MIAVIAQTDRKKWPDYDRRRRECISLFLYHPFWIRINNRQNLRWSITSMSVLRCLWHGAQLRLKRRDSVCVHCRLGQRIPLWDGSYKEGVLVLLSIGRCVTELIVMLAAGSCICCCGDIIHRYCTIRKRSVSLISRLLSLRGCHCRSWSIWNTLDW